MLLGCAAAACKPETDEADARGPDVATDVAIDAALPSTDAVDALTDLDASTPPAKDAHVGSDTGATAPSCDAAVRLMEGVPLRDQSTPLVGSPSAVCRPSDAPQRFYVLTIPVGRRATITVTPHDGWRAVVRVMASCDATDCLTDSESGAPGMPVTLGVDNPQDVALDKIVTVSGLSSSMPGDFDIVFTLGPVSMDADASTDGGGAMDAASTTDGGAMDAASTTDGSEAADVGAMMDAGISSNATCAAARPLSPESPALAQDPMQGGDVVTACRSDVEGRALFYAIRIPAHNAVRVTLRKARSPSWSFVMQLLDGCGTMTCLQERHGYPPDELFTDFVYTNTLDTPRDVILAVSPWGAMETTSPFDLSVSFTPPAANAACDHATPVTDGSVLTGEDTALAYDNNRTCDAGFIGRVLYYTATVPAGYTLAAVNGVGNTVLPIFVFSGCDAAACLASGRGSVFYRNDGTAARDVVVGVGGYGGTTTVRVAIRPSAYRETTMAASCDDMSSATVVPGLDGAFLDGPITALPFPMQFFGTPVTHYSISTPGVIQVYATSTGTPDVGAHIAIPSVEPPNGLIAPFWDELYSNAGASDVRVRLVDGTSRHLTVQWTDWGLSSEGHHLTFQAKLFESDSAIEFHYCAMVPGPEDNRATGSTATIGLETLDGMFGYEHSFDRAGAVSNASAIRLAPIP
jgi:hypothetical protein